MWSFTQVSHSMLLVAGLNTASFGATLSGWTFETNTPADVTDAAIGPTVASESGLYAGLFVGVHAGALSDWTTPAGNGSANSYSAVRWATGDYFQFTSSSVGYKDVAVSFDAIGSGGGPRDFKLQYSTGGAYADVAGAAYSLIENASPNTWTSGAAVPTTSYSFNLTAIPALNEQATIAFRLVTTSNTSINGGTVGTAGSSRVDNVVVSATAVPEPAMLGLLGLMSLLGLRRR